MLDKIPVSQVAASSNLSKQYISQVKNGQRPPSQKLLDFLAQYHRPKNQDRNYFSLFMRSRLAADLSPNTIRFYESILTRFFQEVEVDNATQSTIEKFLLQFKNPGNRARYFQVIKTFFIWRERLFDLSNPVRHMKAPKIGRLILTSLSEDQVRTLMQSTECLRDKAIIALFVESGLRLAELTGIKPEDINWTDYNIKVLGKGRKEALAPFGALSEDYLKQWLSQHNPNGNIWGLNAWGITSMLRRLEAKTGITCNPHTFRRTFAVLLRKAGIDTMTIKELGRWESLEMVQRYTRSFSFQDSMKFYRSPLS
jgi:site-specific recombinase XerD